MTSFLQGQYTGEEETFLLKQIFILCHPSPSSVEYFDNPRATTLDVYPTKEYLEISIFPGVWHQ